MKILVHGKQGNKNIFQPVTVIEKFPMTIGGRVYQFAVHMDLQMPTHFVVSEWDSGLKITTNQHCTAEYAKFAAANRLKGMADTNGESYVTRRLDEARMDQHLNEPNGIPDDEDEL